jgi:hypothetical protein
VRKNGLACQKKQAIIRPMKKLSLILLPLVLTVGCQESGSNGGGGAREAAGEAVNAPTRYIDANVRARHQAQVTTATSSINSAIRMFVVAEGRNPSSLAELLESGYMSQLPELPSGASYSYSAQTGQVTILGY